MEQITEISKENPTNGIQDLPQSLHQKTNWDGAKLCLYNGYWGQDTVVGAVVSCQKHFSAHDTDILLATLPKSGTTWLQALTFAILDRNQHSVSDSPLLTSHPHSLVPLLEHAVYAKHENPDLDAIPAPRVFSTHMHASILPDSIWDSKCKIIYICRNPLDQFISQWHFSLKSLPEEGDYGPLMDEAFDMFCHGVHYHGPFWDHILGYWERKKVRGSKRVLFLRYEDLKEDIHSCVRKIAEFVGFPFSAEEEKQGVVGDIAKLCSFNNLRNLEVNKNGKVYPWFKNNFFFRKGEVGDWTNYLPPSMAQRAAKLMQEKFDGSGLTF